MSRLFSILIVLLVLLLAMGFAAANAGNRVTLELGLVTLYQVPVTLVAFSGLFVGMLVMFATGIHSDLKVRRILRDRLAEESHREQSWIDRNQQDLFDGEGKAGPGEGGGSEAVDSKTEGPEPVGEISGSKDLASESSQAADPPSESPEPSEPTDSVADGAGHEDPIQDRPEGTPPAG